MLCDKAEAADADAEGRSGHGEREARESTGVSGRGAHGEDADGRSISH